MGGGRWSLGALSCCFLQSLERPCCFVLCAMCSHDMSCCAASCTQEYVAHVRSLLAGAVDGVPTPDQCVAAYVARLKVGGNLHFFAAHAGTSSPWLCYPTARLVSRTWISRLQWRRMVYQPTWCMRFPCRVHTTAMATATATGMQRQAPAPSGQGRRHSSAPSLPPSMPLLLFALYAQLPPPQPCFTLLAAMCWNVLECVECDVSTRGLWEGRHEFPASTCSKRNKYACTSLGSCIGHRLRGPLACPADLLPAPCAEATVHHAGPTCPGGSPGSSPVPGPARLALGGWWVVGGCGTPWPPRHRVHPLWLSVPGRHAGTLCV